MGPSSTEYYVQTTITNTEEFPAQLTDCHSHGEETQVLRVFYSRVTTNTAQLLHVRRWRGSHHSR